MHTALIRRVGRRGGFLLLIGAVWILNGLALATEPPPLHQQGQELIVELLAPLPAWGWVFVVGGILSIIYAFRKRRDFPGYIGAIIPCVFWGSVEIVSFFLGLYNRGLIASFVWVLVTCLVLLVSGWAEPVSALMEERDGS